MSTIGGSNPPRVDDPEKTRDPGKQRDPRANPDLLPQRQTVEETQADVNSAGARERFTQRELERPIAEIASKKKDVLSPENGQTRSLNGAKGMKGNTRSAGRPDRGTRNPTDQITPQTRSQMANAGIKLKNLPGQVGGSVQSTNSKGQPMQPVPPQIQRVVTSPNNATGQENADKGDTLKQTEDPSRFQTQAGIQTEPFISTDPLIQLDPEDQLIYDLLDDDHLETFSDLLRRPYTLPMDERVPDLNGGFDNQDEIVKSPSMRSDVSLATEVITQIVKAKLEGRLEPTQSRYYSVASLVYPVRRY